MASSGVLRTCKQPRTYNFYSARSGSHHDGLIKQTSASYLQACWSSTISVLVCPVHFSCVLGHDGPYLLMLHCPQSQKSIWTFQTCIAGAPEAMHINNTLECNSCASHCIDTVLMQTEAVNSNAKL